MAKIEWTRSAVEDLDGIVRLIARDSAFYARRFEAGLVNQVRRRLTTFASSGGMVAEFNDPSIREILHGSYRIIYQVRDDLCSVLAIVHGSRDLLRHWKPDPHE